MWIMEFCERAGNLNEGGRAMMGFILIAIFLAGIGLYHIVQNYIERRWPNKDDDK